MALEVSPLKVRFWTLKENGEAQSADRFFQLVYDNRDSAVRIPVEIEGEVFFGRWCNGEVTLYDSGGTLAVTRYYGDVYIHMYASPFSNKLFIDYDVPEVVGVEAGANVLVSKRDVGVYDYIRSCIAIGITKRPTMYFRAPSETQSFVLMSRCDMITVSELERAVGNALSFVPFAERATTPLLEVFYAGSTVVSTIMLIAGTETLCFGRRTSGGVPLPDCVDMLPLAYKLPPVEGILEIDRARSIVKSARAIMSGW